MWDNKMKTLRMKNNKDLSYLDYRIFNIMEIKILSYKNH